MPSIPANSTAPLSIGDIAQRIRLIRGQRVILDTDLAAFYGETTKRFNQQVNRNLARFPPDFMFQLDEEEFAALRLQIATLKPDGTTGRGQHRKYAPYVFTEHGAIMAATLLNSQRATEISVHVVRAFVEWRAMLANNRELANKLHLLERKVTKHDQAIGELIDSMRQLLAVPEPHKRPIGFITPDKTPQHKALKITKTEKMVALSNAVRKK
jgi:ORF6N domain